MADILQDFPIQAPPERVFRAVATPEGLNSWWTLGSAGTPVAGASYELDFGPDYQWRADVSRCEPGREFELLMTRADADWTGTRVAFHLEERAGNSWVRFSHTGWPEANDHYRVSCHCWALYLRLLRRYVEHGEVIAYNQRLDA